MLEMLASGLTHSTIELLILSTKFSFSVVTDFTSLRSCSFTLQTKLIPFLSSHTIVFIFTAPEVSLLFFECNGMLHYQEQLQNYQENFMVVACSHHEQ
jgi:hypothetical protein